MKCPRDGSQLVEVTLGKKSCKRCPSCDGLFMGLVGANVKGMTLSKLKPKSDHCVETGEKPIVSPHTGELMQRFIYQGVKLDFCKAYKAIWLDAGELDTITKKVASDVKKLKSQKSSSSSSSSYGIVDGGADLVFGFIGEAVSSIFDAF